MRKWISDHLSRLEWRLSLYNMLFGTGGIVSFGVPAWAASATQWIGAYGPIAWVGCGFAGVLAFVLIALVTMKMREAYFDSKVAEIFSQRPHTVNPIANNFAGERIYLNDFISPLQNVVAGKVFTDCHIYGPMNIATMGIGVNGCSYDFVDHAIMPSDGNRITVEPKNLVFFRDVQFIRCAFVKVTFFVPEAEYANIERGGGTNWITRVPEIVPNE